VSSALHITYTADLLPELSPTSPAGTVEYGGIEDLYVTRTSDAGGGFMLHLIDAAYSWVRNVHSEKVSGRHIALETCYRCVVRDSYVHDAWNIDPGASAYGIALERHTSDSLVENNIVTQLNIPIVLAVSSGGNVIAYNYVDDALESSVPDWNTAGIRGHCSFPFMELVEGNWTNQAGMDNVHGGAGYVTFYRNYFSGQRSSYPSTGNVFAVAFDADQLYMNVVGNVLWTAGVEGEVESCGGPAVYTLGRCEDDRVAETVLRHGNFDFLRDMIEWDPAIEDHTLPPSLYLSSKPAFFGDLPWPPVTPEGDEPLGVLPARQRYEQLAP
jgi:hypothetical protein